MDIQQKVEQNLREMHKHLSTADKYEKGSSLVIVDRNQMLDRLQRLSSSIYDLLDKYEMTSVGKDRARRQMEREREEAAKKAQKQSEDIYAAAVLYTDNALNGVIQRIEESRARIDDIYRQLQEELTTEEENIRANKLELQSQLHTLEDTKVYIQAIEEANKRIANEIGSGAYSSEPVHYEEPEIHVNEAFVQSPGDADAPEEIAPEAASQDILPEDVQFDLEKPSLFPKKKNRKKRKDRNNEAS